MIDLIESRLDVELDHPVILPAPLSGDGDRLFCRSSRPISIGIWMKDRVECRLDLSLDDSLCDSIRHSGNTQLSGAALCLRNLYLLHRPAESMNPTTSDSTVCTDSSTGSVRTSQSIPRRFPQNPGWPLLAGTLPIPCVSQCNKVLSMSCHSSPQDGLATFIDRITLPLRSTLITRASSLLRTAPSRVLASVFFLMVFAICHFPCHPERGSHVPFQSLY